MVLDFLFKGFEQNTNLENEKGFPLFSPCLGLGPTPSPPWPAFPPFPLSLLAAAQHQRGPLRGPGGHPALRASPSLPQPLTAGSHAPAPLPGGTDLSGSSSTLSPNRLRVEFNNRARFARTSPDFARCRALYTARSPASPPSHPEPQPPRRVRQSRRRDPPHLQSAAAVRPEPREQLAELRLRFAKSPEFSFCSFELSVPR